MQLQGKTDIEKAIYLLREIEAFLSLNTQPAPEQIQAIKETIKEFVSHFPNCWECGDTGRIGFLEYAACKCSMQSKLYWNGKYQIPPNYLLQIPCNMGKNPLNQVWTTFLLFFQGI